MGKRWLKPLKLLRPVLAHEVETMVAPAYARREELASAIEDVRRLLAENFDASTEEAAVLGRVLAGLRASVDALGDEVALLRKELAAASTPVMEGKEAR
ncbi:MAG: hypothetical protein ABIS21_01995 [Acidimicrobiales bacterium]